MKKEGLRAVITVVLFSVIFNSCGRLPTTVEEEGTLGIRTRILQSSLARTSGSLQTTFDSLIIEISAADMATIRMSRKIDMSEPILTDTISRIPSGTGRIVNVWTVDKAGNVVHTDSSGSRQVRIDPNTSTLLNVILMPAAGSMFLQIGNIPITVDSVYATFISSDNRIWSEHVKRSPKVYLSIDHVSHLTRGILGVAGVDVAGDTLYYAETELTFDAWKTSSINLVFQTIPGSLEMSMAILLPGATVASGYMGVTDTVSEERGELLITEIMYAANDSEYVEIHNPGSVSLEYDTLIIDLDGTHRIFTSVSISAGGYFVFGRKMLLWVNQAHSVQSALDLSSVGNWITLRAKDSTIIDRVIFAGGSNGLEWPNVSGKKAIILNASAKDAVSNNFGRNWTTATSLIEGTVQYGTPGA